jgi:hypothetical protein
VIVAYNDDDDDDDDDDDHDHAIAIIVTTIWNFFGIISVDAIILLLPIPSCTYNRIVLQALR